MNKTELQKRVKGGGEIVEFTDNLDNFFELCWIQKKFHFWKNGAIVSSSRTFLPVFKDVLAADGDHTLVEVGVT